MQVYSLKRIVIVAKTVCLNLNLFRTFKRNVYFTDINISIRKFMS